MRGNSRLGDKQTDEISAGNGDPNLANQTNDANKQPSDNKNPENKNKLWMDFEDFFVCFK